MSDFFTQLFWCKSVLFGFAASAHPMNFCIHGLFEAIQLLRRYAILALGVVSGFNRHLAQSNDIRPADDGDILAMGSGFQPFAEVFLGVGDG